MEHLVLLPILLRRIQVADLHGKPLEGGLVGLHLLDVIGGKGIVMHKLIVAIQKGLHGPALYLANLANVVGLAVLCAVLLFAVLSVALLFVLPSIAPLFAVLSVALLLRRRRF